MTPATTTGAPRQGDARQTTSRGNGSQRSQNSAENRNPSIMHENFEPVTGQRVRPNVTRHAGKIGTVISGPDEDGAYRVAFEPLRHTGHVPTAYFKAHELEPVRRDDTVPASAEDIVTHVTGVLPPYGHGWSESDPHECRHDEPHEGLHECERCGQVWVDGGQSWHCTVPGCSYATWVSDEALVESPDSLDESKRTHIDDHEANPGADSVDVATFRTVPGDVIVYRLFAGEIHADLLTDARIEKPEHLRELSAVLMAAAKAWEAAQ